MTMRKSVLGIFATALAITAGANIQAFGQSATAAPTPIYRDATRSAADRAADLLAQMTVDEKIGQMTLVEKDSIKTPDIAPMGIGGLLSGGGGYPKTGNTAQNWAAMVDGFQKQALASRLGIPLLYGVDAVHGDNNVYGTVIFPHNVGLGAANDPALMQKIGRATAQVTVATGIYWDYAPMVAVAQDIRWGRIYESYSQDPALVSALSSALIQGLQGDHLRDPTSVLATAKHFVGDGGTAWGSSTTSGYSIDQGVTSVDEATLRATHLAPYIAAIKSGVQSIMVSFSSWGGLKMSAQKYLITDVLKGELGFTGFTVSDWQAIDAIPGGYPNAVKTSVNAGLDMIMVPSDYVKFISTLKAEIANGDIPQARIDDAVRRILTVKFKLGLFEHPLSNPSLLSVVGSADQRALARKAVSETQVLLQNNGGALPIAKDTPSIYVAGGGADDIGIQSGGWTIEWQGGEGNVTPGTTILQAIKATVSPQTTVTYMSNGQIDGMADVGIAVVGEHPYAEGMGDKANLGLSRGDLATVKALRQHSKKLIVILLSGRPMIIGPELNQSDAFIASWLPGTEGQGIADVLFGDQPFTGKLSFTWPRDMSQVPLSAIKPSAAGCAAPLFPFGYGLTTADKTTVNDPCVSVPTPTATIPATAIATATS